MAGAQGEVTAPPEWWATTVDADDAGGLRSAIAEQERLASLVGAMNGDPAECRGPGEG